MLDEASIPTCSLYPSLTVEDGFLAERVYVGIWKGQTLKLDWEHSILLCDVPTDMKGG